MTQANNELYLTFAGLITLDAARNVSDVFCDAVRLGIETVHLSIQSTGGNAMDGAYLYNLIRNLPLRVVTYNLSNVGSASVLFYLCGEERVVAQEGVFMIHYPYSIQGANMISPLSAGSLSDSLAVEARRLDSILSSHLTLEEREIAHYKRADLYIGAQRAIECGFANRIGYFSPPAGAKVVNIKL